MGVTVVCSYEEWREYPPWWSVTRGWKNEGQGMWVVEPSGTGEHLGDGPKRRVEKGGEVLG